MARSLRSCRQATTLILFSVVLSFGASATVVPGHDLRVRSGGQAVPVGEMMEIEVEVVAEKERSFAILDLSGTGWSEIDWTPRDTRWVGPQDEFTFLLRARRGPDAGPLTLSYEIDGWEMQTAVDPVGVEQRRKTPEKPERRWEKLPIGELGPSGVAKPEPVPFEASETQEIAESSSNKLLSLIQGTIVYVDKNGQLRGADGVTVRAFDRDPFYLDDFLGQDVIGPDGSFSITPSNLDESKPDIYLEIRAGNSKVVMENAGVLELDYVLHTEISFEFAGSVLDYGTLGPPSEGYGKLFYILSTLTKAWRWLDAKGYDVPKVDCQYPDGSGKGGYYLPNEIHVEGDFEWYTAGLIHEYGHHWQYHYAPQPAPDYSSPWCNVGSDESHCLWCEETEFVAWSEGFADWLSLAVTREYPGEYGFESLYEYSFELIHPSPTDPNNNVPCPVSNVLNVEGHAAAILNDIMDDATEDDDFVAPGNFDDVMSLGSDEILYVTDLHDPVRLLEFLDEFKNTYPLWREDLWLTVRNNDIDIDVAPPPLVTNIQTPDHLIGPQSTDGTITYTWDQPVDDMSGVNDYDILISTSPSDPGTSAFVGDVGVWTTPELGPGQYWFNIRARDASGRWTPGYASHGPISIREPYPADLQTWTRPLWDDPLIVRAEPTVSINEGSHPSILLGDQNATWWSFSGNNIGELPTQQPFYIDFLLDGVPLQDSYHSITVQPFGGEFIGLNEGPLLVRGGRHTVELFVESHETEQEIEETNNRFGAQWPWVPSELAPGQMTTRTRPPDRMGGWGSVPGLQPPFQGDVTPFYNCDGLRMDLTPGQGELPVFSAMAIRTVDVEADYDCYLDFPVTTGGVTAGFSGGIERSERAAGLTDAVLVYPANAPLSIWDVGIVNMTDDSSSYIAETRKASFMPFDSSVNVQFAQDQMVALKQFSVPSTGWFEVRLLHTGADGPFRVRILDSNFSTGALSDAGVDAITVRGEARLDFLTSGPGMHSVVVYRDAEFAGTDPQSVSLTVRPMPIDLSTVLNTNWEFPLVPTIVQEEPGASPSIPSQLYGDAASTYLNATFVNNSFTPVSLAGAKIHLDGQLLESFLASGLGAGQSFEWFGSSPVAISAGRHVLSLSLDPDDILPERDETNNHWAGQYGWLPPTSPWQSPILRMVPPKPTEGWSLLPDAASGKLERVRKTPPGVGESDVERWFNCDGLETPGFDVDTGRWVAIATAPPFSWDVDLRLHLPSTEPELAFIDPVAESISPGIATDFVLADVPAAMELGVNRFQAGVVRADQSNFVPNPLPNYTAQIVDSQALPDYPSGRFGDYNLAAGEILKVHEVQLADGPIQLRLENVSGNVDWGLSIFEEGQSYFGKADALVEVVDDGGPGEDEAFSTLLPADATYAFVIWKKDTSSLAEPGMYAIHFGTGTSSGDGTPTASRLDVTAHPNPFNPRTTVAFELERPGRARVDVFSSRGELVRSLYSGSLPAGRHERVWDGIDDRGQQVSSGVYFVRLSTREGEVRTKLTLLK